MTLIHTTNYVVHNGANIEDADSIANSFNDNFVNMGNRIASYLPLSDCSYYSFVTDRRSNFNFLVLLRRHFLHDQHIPYW